VIENLITLYRAMGGGWQIDPDNEETFTTAFGPVAEAETEED